MSYEAQGKLERDTDFQLRVAAVNVQQAHVYKDDARADFVALANAIMRGTSDDPGFSLLRLAAAAPGAADLVDNGDGTIDQSKITDGDILAATQANWQTVADLYFDADGTPKP